MEIHTVRHDGHNSSCSCDEYEMNTNNLTDRGWLETQSIYSLTLVGDLRDRTLKETHREFIKWLCRLAKRLHVESVLVNIRGYEESITIDETAWNNPFEKMYELPSWGEDDNEPAWWEHLMWKRWGDTPLPLEHVVKYYNVEEADNEFFKEKGK